MPQALSSPARRAPLDERSFEQLLAAAFVMQEHNSRSRPKPASIDFDFTQAVSAAGALQQEVASGARDLPASARLIAERALAVTFADGTAVGIVVDESLTYIGVAGTAAGDAGRRFSVPDSPPASCIISAQTLQYCGSDGPTLPRSFAGRSDLRSVIAVPVIQKGTVLGVFELRFSEARSFAAEEVRAAELFAGIVNLAITTAAKKHATENTDSAPQNWVSDKYVAGFDPVMTEPPSRHSAELSTDPASRTLCGECGNAISSKEAFCGRCGASQSELEAASETSEIHLLPTIDDSPVRPAKPSAEGQETDAEDAAAQEIFPTLPFRQEGSSFASDGALALQHDSLNALVPAEALRIVPAETTLIQDGEPDSIEQAPWSSAKKAMEWFEGLRQQQQPALANLREFWQTQRANLWLGASALILLFAIFQFFTSPVSPQSSAANSAANKDAAGPQLSFFESLLVSMGLAEAPAAVSYTGNPEARVWVDTRTALYYCAGTGQYGKTPGGKFTSQRDAQQDQFEPAHRRVCP